MNYGYARCSTTEEKQDINRQMENINLLFGTRLYVKHDKPTNGEFIALIADRLAIEQSA